MELSSEGKAWKKVYGGTSSGNTVDFETVDFDDAAARYVRIVGHGGSKEEFKEWTNLTEVQILEAGPAAE